MLKLKKIIGLGKTFQKGGQAKVCRRKKNLKEGHTDNQAGIKIDVALNRLSESKACPLEARPPLFTATTSAVASIIYSKPVSAQPGKYCRTKIKKKKKSIHTICKILARLEPTVVITEKISTGDFRDKDVWHRAVHQ